MSDKALFGGAGRLRLVRQLKPGGRMIIPVGGRFMTQQLLLLEKTYDGEVITRQIAAVRFVPLTRGR